ncbi:indolepyruvate ferredoxin oxidoreductase alpha subunit [Aequitasia blattaphilus]|uniref:Indolepyruvate oxidoreductase subunit IorA n=1 Tax=Aequitasia blattaphilus TaxID=2949332 RepID=A0ABT1E914_9FIRM|nr:indolepyruvate ferredoxin oxidoreductase subunit alpha [Aequitasia blattaphilus]MCP1102310.1 indolepyruvate ferredoxin oxidoreductase subunit alpha [Aequitasia blattaphilus]MCR8614950.1 indolepyruvate ferredoxin oxidoreductase subunit alpha [Aequitasia blattaphilus]
MSNDKKIMLGNEAIARGVYEAGVKVSSAYPGTPSTEISEYMVQYKDDVYCEWAPNEKVATEVAIGASISGVRSLACMKHVGFNVAADPAYTMSYIGVNGGMVIVVADDPGLYSSQNEQDTRMVARAAKIPVIEPSDSKEAKEFIKEAYEISEKFDRPIIFRITTRLAHSQGQVPLEERKEVEDKPYEKNVAKTVMMPGNAKNRHVEIEKRMEELGEAANTLPMNKVEYRDKKIGVITSGIPYEYVREALPEASTLKLGMVYPLPKQMIMDFAKEVETLYVIEELDPFMEEQIKSWGIDVIGKDKFTLLGEYSANMIRENILGETIELKSVVQVPNRPPILCPGCPHRSVYHVLNKLKIHAAGDIGCYTLGAVPPLSVVDTTVCMGASISTLHGMEKARGKDYVKNWVAVIGDSTFLHTGVNSLMNMVYNKATGTVMILDNSTTGMTGHQEHAATGKTLQGDPTNAVNLMGLCQAIGIQNVQEINAFDLEKLEAAVKEETAKDEISVIITKSPCVLLTKGKKPHYEPISEKCKKCGMCLKPGCPAMSKNEDGTIDIDETMCTGCGLCYNLCKFDAIKFVKVGE